MADSASLDILTPAAARPGAPGVRSLPRVQHGGPSPAERRLVEFVYERDAEADQAMADEGAFEYYDEWVRTYWGEQEPETLPMGAPSVQINEVKRLVLMEVADLIEADPRIYVTRDPAKGQRDENVEKVLQAFWSRYNVNLKVAEALIEAMKCPVGYLTATWDPTKMNGRGEVVVASRDPRSVKPAPGSVDDENWLYVILEDILDLTYIRRRWPDRGARIGPEDDVSVKMPPSRYSARTSPGGYYGPMTEWGQGVDAAALGYQKARARVLSMFTQDDEVESVPDVLKDDADKVLEIRELLKLKYPMGRLIQVANHRLLYDGPEPYPFFPVIRVLAEPAPGRFFASSTVGALAPLNDAANKMDSNFIENGVRLNHGIVAVAAQSGIDVEHFAAIPGQIVVCGRSVEQDFKVFYPPSMPAEMVQGGDLIRRKMQGLMGQTESRMGGTHRGNVGADLTETEISQSQGITRFRSRLLHPVLTRLAQLILAIMSIGYTTRRYLPHFDGGVFEQVPWDPAWALEGRDYQVHIDPASILPRSRTAMARLAPHMYRMKAVDRLATLEQVGWPNAKVVAQRMDQQEMQMAALAAQAKQRQRGGGARR